LSAQLARRFLDGGAHGLIICSVSPVLASTFQLAPGFGPRREQRLWGQGIGCWTDLLDAPAGVSSPGAGDAALRAAVAEAQDALARGDADRLAGMLPSGEHWRMFADFADGAAYLDIETGDDDVACAGISAIGIFDRAGPRILLAGRDLQLFPQVARGYSMLLTFNGLSFDVPILRRAFPGVEAAGLPRRSAPPAGARRPPGGLKAIERERALHNLRLARPPHLARIDGWTRRDCGASAAGRAATSTRFACSPSYNLHDVIHLRTLIAYAYNALVDKVQAPAVRARVRAVPVPTRGDVLYDVSKILLSL